MKLPDLPKREPRAAKQASSGKIKAPAFVQDLYKDMRDRRLIIPALALLIAIIAVPFVLGSPSEPAAVAPPPASDPDAVAVEPAVLAVQETGVRDFQERLDELQRKDPFGDRFDPAPAEAAEDLSALEEPVETGTGTGSSTAVDTGPVVPSDGGPTTPAPGGTPSPAAPAQPFVLVPRVDVEVGIVDRDRRQTLEGVKSGEVLPSKKTPVAMFLGNSDDSGSSEFLVSRDVSKVNGEGDCKPGKNKCEFLRIKEGDSAYLRFADGKRYVITVREIYFERRSEDEVRGN